MDREQADEPGLLVFIEDCPIERAAVEAKREEFAALNKQLHIIRVYRAGEPHPSDLVTLDTCVLELTAEAQRVIRYKSSSSSADSVSNLLVHQSILACVDETLEFNDSSSDSDEYSDPTLSY